MMDEREAKIVWAAVALVQLWEQMAQNPRGPHPDFYCQSVHDCEKALREAVRGSDPVENGVSLCVLQDFTSLLKR